MRNLLARLLAAIRRQPQPQRPESQGQDDANNSALAALVVILLSGLSPEDAAARATPTLRALGRSDQAIAAAFDLLIPHVHPPSLIPAGPASGHVARTEAVFQAAYLSEATKRLTLNANAGRERRYLAQHLDAARGRREAAATVDRVAEQFGPLLGWYAIRDTRTTSECRRAHGSNFAAARPPRIGYPGTLHGGACRCVPGPPHKAGPEAVGRTRAPLVDEVVTGEA